MRNTYSPSAGKLWTTTVPAFGRRFSARPFVPVFVALAAPLSTELTRPGPPDRIFLKSTKAVR